MGLGNAGINPAISNSALVGVKLRNMGMASGINNIYRQFGNCIGIVVIGLIVGNGFKMSLLDHLGNNQLTRTIIAAGPFSGMQLAKKYI